MARRSSGENTRTRIIDTAKKLFAEKGYDKVLVTDIAREAGLSDGAMYEYFEGKEDLLLTIPDHWISESKKEVTDHMFGLEGSFIKLRKYVWWFFRYVEQNPETAGVVFLFLKTNRAFMATEVCLRLKEVYVLLAQVFEEGRKNGEMKADLDPIVARSIVLGTLEHVVINWLLKDRSFSLFDKVEQIYACFVDAFKAHPKEL